MRNRIVQDNISKIMSRIKSPTQGKPETKCRAVAQTGSAFPWGGRGRKFKSCQPDSAEASSGQARFARMRCFRAEIKLWFAQMRVSDNPATSRSVYSTYVAIQQFVPYAS